ncbi:SUI1 domain [Trypanosoma melophagium]|uniref:SUI1 domain n=1 Tax=Trypanosoma melophagium TaxID=715481 RepID=UPI00351A9CE1|nr:SUI1 domain [Trypanosoma melophagium]
MGRNKKNKSSAAHVVEKEGEEEEEVLSEAGTPQEAPSNEPASSHSDSESSVEEEKKKKKKVYHGNKLKRNAGGKGKDTQENSSALQQQGKEGGGKKSGAELGTGTVAADVDASLQEAKDEEAALPHGPVDVLYCPICTFPAEMCEFSGMYEQCRPWLLEHAKELAEAEERGRKRRVLTEKERLERLVQGRGTKKAIERIVLIEVSQRKGRKMTTSVKGMDLFGFNLKDLSREWKKAFSCGAGVTTSEESKQNSVDIQGNVAAQLIELLPVRYNIPKDAIYQMEDKKKKKCYDAA